MQIVQEYLYDSLCRFLEKDIEKCLYIYLNLLNYKREKSSICVYVDTVDGPNVIMVEYHNSFQVFKRGDILTSHMEEIVEIVNNKKPKMISGTTDLVEKIHIMTRNVYNIEYGGIFLENKFRKVKDEGLIVEATDKDAQKIAELIALDGGLGGHYVIPDLEWQIKARIRANTGRSYVIFENGKIVAHTATYAESDKIAVVSGTIIHPEYRDKNYYFILSNYIISQLVNEGKRVYTFAVDEKLYKYHIKTHQLCGTYARIRKGE